MMKAIVCLAVLVLCVSCGTVEKRAWFDSLQDLVNKAHATLKDVAFQKPTSYNLTYFDLKARGEIIRVLFKLAGQNFEDTRVNPVDWPTIKPTTPLGQMPTLDITINGEHVILVQSMAIARYIARDFDLAGDTSLQQAISDMFCDTGTDVINAASKYVLGPQDATSKAAALASTQSMLNGMNKLLDMHREGTFVLGEKPGLADAAIYMATEFINSTAVTPLFGHAAEIRDKFAEVPAIAKWIQDRPSTPY